MDDPHRWTSRWLHEMACIVRRQGNLESPVILYFVIMTHEVHRIVPISDYNFNTKHFAFANEYYY